MLNRKQERFIQELVKGHSQRQAYKIAYKPAKMNPRTMDNKASRLFKKAAVRERYDMLMEEAAEKAKFDAIAIREDIIRQQEAILKASFGDLFEVKAGRGNRHLVSVPKADISKFDMRAVKSYRYDKEGRLMLELYDKQPAINSLMELYGIAAGQQNREDINIILDEMQEEYGE